MIEGEGVAGSTLKELCDTPRNTVDYIELATAIPNLNARRHSSTRRSLRK